MVKINKHIEIVSSSIIGLSSMSHESRTAIQTVLSKHYSLVRITLVDNLSDLRALVARKPDLVFLGMKFVPENPSLGAHDPLKIWVSEFLDQHGIAYTGSTRKAHEYEQVKHVAKRQMINAGIRTANYFVARHNQKLIPEDITLRYPVFIKPTDMGGGAGIDSNSVAHDFTALKAKASSISTKLGSDSLIEEYLQGREFSVAILRQEHSNDYSAMPIELVAEPDEHGDRLLSNEVKSSNNEVVLAVTDPICRSQVTSLALAAFHALGGRDYGRIDVRMNTIGHPHFLEANLIPSLISGYGSFPKASLMNENLEYEPMILRIVNMAMARKFEGSRATTVIPQLLLPLRAARQHRPSASNRQQLLPS